MPSTTTFISTLAAVAVTTAGTVHAEQPNYPNVAVNSQCTATWNEDAATCDVDCTAATFEWSSCDLGLNDYASPSIAADRAAAISPFVAPGSRRHAKKLHEHFSGEHAATIAERGESLFPTSSDVGSNRAVGSNPITNFATNILSELGLGGSSSSYVEECAYLSLPENYSDESTCGLHGIPGTMDG